MSVANFIARTGPWGLTPNNQKAIGLMLGAKDAGAPTGMGAGYSHQLNVLFMATPDLSGIDRLAALKQAPEAVRIAVLTVCHELFHLLHKQLDPTSFVPRSKVAHAHYKNEEEELTVTGKCTTQMIPSQIQISAPPGLFNEHSLAKILGIAPRATLREGAVGLPVDASIINLSAPSSGPAVDYVACW